MPVRFTVLASGSSGNATLIEVDGFGLLVDFGIGPQVIAERLSAFGSSWTSYWPPATSCPCTVPTRRTPIT